MVIHRYSKGLEKDASYIRGVRPGLSNYHWCFSVEPSMVLSAVTLIEACLVARTSEGSNCLQESHETSSYSYSILEVLSWFRSFSLSHLLHG